jgi:dTDP-4-dehydrorhamnose reductase
MTRILVTGGSGQVGGALSQLKSHNLEFIAPRRDELDLSNARSIKTYLASEPFAAVINCAAYTAVDKAESERDLAWHVNATAPGLIAEHCAKAKIPLLHVSTDYVFSGEALRPYVEDDVVGPINVYGASKEAGEAAIRAVTDAHIILRTSWVVSATGHNFVKTMLRLATDRDELRVVADQQGRPTSAQDIAQTLSLIVTQAIQGEAKLGTFHFANSGDTNWADFARMIFELSHKRGGPSAHVTSITTADYPTPAKRPHNSRLDTRKLEAVYGIKPRPWTEALNDILSILIPQGAS